MYVLQVLAKFATLIGLWLMCTLLVLVAIFSPILVLTVIVSLCGGLSTPALVCVLLSGPIGVFLLSTLFVNFVVSEAALIREVGPDHALWCSRYAGLASTVNLALPVEHVVCSGHDDSGPSLAMVAKALHMSDDAVKLCESGSMVLGSILWSKFILLLDSCINDLGPYLSFIALWLVLSRLLKATAIPFIIKLSKAMLMLTLITYHMPADKVVKGLWWVIKLVVHLRRLLQGDDIYWQWLQWRLTYILVQFVGFTHSVNSAFQRKYSEALASGSSKLSAHFRVFVMKTATVISDLALPNYVRTRMKDYSRGSLQDSIDLMRELGWPINTKLEDGDVQAAGSFKEWLLCGTDFKQGIHNMKLWVDRDLDGLRASAVLFKRSEEYASIENELEATSRYFHSPRYSYPDLQLDDVWYIVGSIFKHSRLVPFNYIIKMWEKRYSLGSFMRDPFNMKRKYRRSHFIEHIGGYAPFKRLWARTFHFAPSIIPVSAVSVKGEALPPKKWANNMVRTVTGSPITQYILSTIWNYGPNHHFDWVNTPIKIGMPLNGYWMTKLWMAHSRCQFHLQGDMKEYDSTISGRVNMLIAAVRKKGYEFHKDRDRIADLIDINYRLVDNQLLNTTSTGNIYYKGTGLTTGHSSTSMDNSLALVILYLMAWKELTGLSAKEFVHYNQLSNFGDDHILSVLAVRPAVWTARNIEKTMAKWGVTVTFKATSDLSQVSFLSKWGRKATKAEIDELAKHGIHDVKFVVWHDRERLVGKMVAKIKSMNPSYRVKRLLSYLSLTAHSEDIYDQVVAAIRKSSSMMMMLKNNKLSIPSYSKILKQWYSPSLPKDFTWHELVEEDEPFYKTGKMVEYGSVSNFDMLLGALSMVPDLFSPLLFNYGYSRALQAWLRQPLSWVVDLISTSNGVVASGALSKYIERTPYRFIDPSLHVVGLSGASKSDMIVRHWLFMVYCKLRGVVTLGATWNFIVSKVATMNFIWNAKVQTEARDNLWSLDLLLVLSLLSFVHVPNWFGWAFGLNFPDLQLIAEMISHFLLVQVWSSVPPNFNELTSSIKALSIGDKPLGIVSPTGTGKSTSLIQHILNVAGSLYHKIIVIEPRSLLVAGLSSYMGDMFGPAFTGSTTGVDFDKNAKVVYITPQSLMQRFDLFHPNNLIILDEAHLSEEFYLLFKRLLGQGIVRSIFLSATPSDDWNTLTSVILPVPMAGLFTVKRDTRPGTKVETFNQFTEHYSKLVINEVSRLPPGVRALVLCPTIDMTNKLSDTCPVKSSALNSTTPLPSKWDCQVYFATSVADVGITIPDVELVISANFSHYVDGKFVLIDNLTRMQRAGRTGRTVNGKFIMVEYNFDESLVFKEPPGLTHKQIRSMALQGVPVELLAKVDQNMLIEAMGINKLKYTDESLPKVFRAYSLLLRNISPVILSKLSQKLSNTGFGEAPEVVASGAGTMVFSDKPYELYEENALQMCLDTITAGMTGSAEVNLDAAYFYNTKPGAIANVVDLVTNLAKNLSDGIATSVNTLNKSFKGSLDDLNNYGKIIDTLFKAA